MSKKTPYAAYYFSIDPDITPGQLQSWNYPSDHDISAVSDRMDKNAIYGMVSREESFHPRVLRIPSPPKVVYRQGDLTLLERSILGVVGPRLMSPYAEKVLRELFTQLLGYQNIVTISGLADGVDTRCHQLSLEHRIPTIAVLGGGFGYFLKWEKRELMRQIVDAGGLVISQYKHGFRPTGWSFPDRNRIIAGLADALFVPEATEKSGSLITADIAHQIGRPIGAPMNSIFSESSKWTNKRITEWRIAPLADISSFLEKYFIRAEESLSNSLSHALWDSSLYSSSLKKLPELSEDEKTIYTILIHSTTPMTIAELTAATQRPTHQLLPVLTLMEMSNYICELSPWTYSLL